MVATYDMKPEMSAPEVTDKLVAAIEGGSYDVIICNYANPDMVGHTGKFDAAVKAIEAIDACLGRILETLSKHGGEMLVTADHGNAELMLDNDSGQSHTAHTTNLVPLIYVGRPAKMLDNGALSDIAPTMLALMNMPVPPDMTGTSLVELLPDLSEVSDRESVADARG
jgi:2,3-bisphosphoglycerate-independent phosphoglycerate mutase